MKPAKDASQFSVVMLLGLVLSGCITSRVEDAREGLTGINEGESVVIMAKSYHLATKPRRTTSTASRTR